MIKYVQCVRKRSDLSVADFRKSWKDYSAKTVEFARGLGARRVTVSTTLSVADNEAIRERRGTADPFDGLVEVYFESGPQVFERMRDPGNAAAMQAFRDAQEKFMDVPGSCFFWSTDDEAVDL